MVHRTIRARRAWPLVLLAAGAAACGGGSSGHYLQPSMASRPDPPARAMGGEAYSAAYHSYWSPGARDGDARASAPPTATGGGPPARP